MNSKRILWNIAAVVLAATGILLLTGKAVQSLPASWTGDSAPAESGYEELLFDTSRVHSVEIRMEEADYADMLETASEKNRYPASVTVDGESFSEIAVSTKGSASLRAVASNPDSDRYSLKLEFDEYEDDQSYHGLETIHLNNNVSDASYMRDYFSYSMFRSIGCPAPLASYVTVSINGEAYGFFLAVENVGKGFLNRALDKDGELYKPESSGMRNAAALGADLAYNGNLPLSYSDIFDNAVTKCSGKDEKAVIQALKNLSEGNIEEGLYADTVCRYFAVHNFTLNSDSYTSTGSLIHNYYLYENDGLLAMIPWDYNNAYALSDSIQMEFMMNSASGELGKRGGSASGEANPASYYINKGIDSALIGEGGNRPMWSFIPEDPEYLELYHSYVEQLITQYYESGFFEKEFNRVYAMIFPYVDGDSSRYYSMEEFLTSAEELKDICTLRALSIRKQLDGELSCDSALQSKEDWVNASILDK